MRERTSGGYAGAVVRLFLSVGYGLGVVVGALVSPLVYLLARRRGARLFHPDGETFQARFTPLADVPVARALAGPALVRLSATLVRGVGVERPDVLGLAVRFRDARARLDDAAPQPGDQDLLTASFRGFGTALADRDATDVRDWLGNTYRAVARFDVPGEGIRQLRWVGVPRPGHAPTRRARLDEAIAAGEARFVLEISQGPDAWLALGELALEGPSPVDQARLELTPFRAGRGLRALGFVNGLRRGAYPASQRARRVAGPAAANPQ
jgi:hypothetical protein